VTDYKGAREGSRSYHLPVGVTPMLTPKTFCRVLCLIGLVLLFESGCLCPPCPAGGGATTAAAATTPAGNAPAATGPSPNRLVIWDGDKISPGQSWADCTKKDQKCKSALAKTGGAGVNGSTGLKWHGEGPDWMGAGWNWFGWWPQTAGTDITPYASLTFQIKVDAKSPELAPEPDAIGIGLTCNNSKLKSCTTTRASVSKYVADFADGQWHKVVMPIADLLTGEGIQFDKSVAWQFDFSEWSGPPRDFNVYVDDIAFEK
jgi:hypothetical protein